MGIQGLLQAVQKNVEVLPIASFKGQRIAIDISGWLHKGVYFTVEDLVDSNFRDSQLYVDFILNRIQVLATVGIIPVVVFDGKRNYLKSETNDKRSDIRMSYMDAGKRLLANANKFGVDEELKVKLRHEAVQNFQKGMSVTGEMEKNTIAALRKMQIEVIISPYEADSQLAALCRSGYCDAVLTEDSDIIVYSAACGVPFPILTKYDKAAGSVQSLHIDSFLPINEEVAVISQEEEGIAAQNNYNHDGEQKKRESKKKIVKTKKEPKVKGFLNILRHYFRGEIGKRMFVQMCVLAGCDYVDNIASVGIVTACQAVVKCKEVAADDRFARICQLFREGGKDVPEAFENRLKRAEALFYYHPTFCTQTNQVTNFLEPNIVETDREFEDVICNNCTQAEEKEHEKDQVAAAKGMKKKGIEEKDKGGGVVNFRNRSGSIDSIESFEDSNSDENLFAVKPKLKSASVINLIDMEACCCLPKITADALAQVGSEAELLRAAQVSLPSITITDLCRGHVSCKDYSEIRPKYPWDDPSLLPKNNQCHSNVGWHVRRQLVNVLARNGNGSSQMKAGRSNTLRNAFNRGTIAPKKGVNLFATKPQQKSNISKTRPYSSSQKTIFGLASKTSPLRATDKISAPPDIMATTVAKVACFASGTGSIDMPYVLNESEDTAFPRLKMKDITNQEERNARNHTNNVTGKRKADERVVVSGGNGKRRTGNSSKMVMANIKSFFQ